MNCPRCQQIDGLHVIDSRGYDFNRRRRYHCDRCSFRFTTYEITASEYDKLRTVKIDIGAFDSVIASLRAIKVQFGEQDGNTKD